MRAGVRGAEGGESGRAQEERRWGGAGVSARAGPSARAHWGSRRRATCPPLPQVPTCAVCACVSACLHPPCDALATTELGRAATKTYACGDGSGVLYGMCVCANVDETHRPQSPGVSAHDVKPQRKSRDAVLGSCVCTHLGRFARRANKGLGGPGVFQGEGAGSRGPYWNGGTWCGCYPWSQGCSCTAID